MAVVSRSSSFLSTITPDFGSIWNRSSEFPSIIVYIMVPSDP